MSGTTTTHKGVDFAAPKGTPIKSTGAGTVIKAGWQDPSNTKVGFGQRVVIDHGGGNVSVYAHMETIGVRPGDRVAKGQEIGTVGSTGKSTGPHLHYEERHNNTAHPPTFAPANYRPDSADAGDALEVEDLYTDPQDEEVTCPVVPDDVQAPAELSS